MRLGLQFPERLGGVLTAIRDELEQLIAAIQSSWSKEHRSDGTHGNITSPKLTIDELSSDSTVMRFLKGMRWVNGPWLLDEDSGVGTAVVQVTITTNQNDFAPQNIDNAIILDIINNTSSLNLTGIKANGKQRRVLAVYNNSSTSQNIVLVHASASSAAANRFALAGNANVTVIPGSLVWLYYDVTNQRWRLFSHGIVPAVLGGTGLGGYTVGDLLTANTTTSLTTIAAGAAGRYLRGAGAGTQPAWSAVILPNALTQYLIPYADQTDQLGGQIAIGSSGHVLTSNGPGAAPSFASAAHNLLSTTHSDTTASTVTRGALIVGTGATPKWDDLIIGSANRLLRSDGTDVSWAQVTLTTDVTGTLPVANGGTGATTFTNDRVLTGNSTSAIVDEANLTFDGTTLTLGGGQIAFPATQNASSGANTLDDYEEGTWTPTITADGGASGQTYSVQVGSYIKIGQLVVAAFNVELTNKGTLTGSLQIGNLPFTSNSANVQWSGPIIWGSTVTSFYSMFLAMGSSTTSVYLRGQSSAGTSTGTLATGDIGNTTGFSGSITYRASA